MVGSRPDQVSPSLIPGFSLTTHLISWSNSFHMCGREHAEPVLSADSAHRSQQHNVSGAAHSSQQHSEVRSGRGKYPMLIICRLLSVSAHGTVLLPSPQQSPLPKRTASIRIASDISPSIPAPLLSELAQPQILKRRLHFLM